MKDYLIGLLDWIYRKKCYFCGNSKESVKMCTKCFDSLEFLPIVKNKTIHNVDVYCAGVYSKNLQKMIRGLKYHKQRELAYYQAKFMWKYWINLDLDGEFQILAVPIFEKRKKQRKYNHMDLIAEEFAILTGYNVVENGITRIKDTKPQYKLNKAQRKSNLSEAFKVNIESFDKGKTILILDDICTTGSTFEEMIKELNKNNLHKIICFATTTPFGD